MAGWQFWIDRGGTFTDIVALRPHGGEVVEKLLSENPERYEDAALEGMQRILDANGATFADVAVIKLGTTVATNALLERKGENVALVVTAGFGDALRADLGKSLLVGGTLGHGIEHVRKCDEERRRCRGLVDAQEHPCAFAVPAQQPGFGKNTNVPRHARLRLAEHLGKLADGKLHALDKRHDAEPGRVRQCAENVDRRGHDAAHKVFFI